ncbi:trigger factor [Helicovermis profundi]|uniref:Trigger factor n=1 Tax=Helicovermis profundi TaxID=3065157 RepID=A0AAU9ETS6_9FIRM|nr:trigger factor [Clostridia bacterium S502]
MSSSLKTKENNKVTIEIKVSKEEFKVAIQKAYLKERKKFNIPGFRKGKAPRKIIEAQYGVEVFYEEAINVVLPEEYSKAVEELKLDVVDSPDIDVKELDVEKEIIIEAVVTVKPEVELGEYKGIEVEEIKVEVSDEDVDKELEKSRDMGARLISVEDRAVQDGDSVIIDYAGFVNHEQFEGGTATNQTLVIGSKTFIPGFEEQLIGAKLDSKVDVVVTFPEDYSEKTLAGKEAVFNVEVKGIKVKELPELDDEFAKDTSEFDTLEELKNDIKVKLQESAEKNAKLAQRDKVIDAVSDTMKADIPDAMIDTEVSGMLREFDYQLSSQGISLDQYVQYTGGSLDALKDQMKDDAAIRVKTALVLEKVAELEGFKAEETEINEELQKIADAQKSTMEEVKKLFKNDDYSYIEDSIVSRKTVDFLVENAKLV